VSHATERKEKNCLNCGATVVGRYCHVCGQENVETKETFWHMVTHFFYDITHFDGSFFVTAKWLLFKPGFLSKEYMLGRRKKYLHPVRMYVFTSAVFFLIFFSFLNPGGSFKTNFQAPLTSAQRKKMIAELMLEMKTDTARALKEQLRLLEDTGRTVTTFDLIKIQGSADFTFLNITGAPDKFQSVRQYDSFQKTLPVTKRDNWLLRKIRKKEIGLDEKYGTDPETALKKFADSFLHKLPYLLFISLPLFALFLKLLYVRHRQYYYADHAIFSIHHYVFSFLLLLAVFIAGDLSGKAIPFFFNTLVVILLLYGAWYLYKAMQNYYGQRRFKTFVKFLLLNLVGFISLMLLFILFVIFSVFEL
jgi:hypothetical protein